MRRPLREIAACVALALVVAGCGSGAHPASGASPLSSALSYFPPGSPFVLTVATGPNSAPIKGLRALEARLPAASLGTAAAESRLNQLGLEYDTDIRPLLGHPIVIGVEGSGLGSGKRGILAAWVTGSAAALDRVVHKLPGVHSAGSHAGASLYTASGAMAVAVEGTTVLVGGSLTELEAALDRHAAHAASAQQPAGPADALLSASGQVGQLVASRRVPWVRALRGYSASLSASGSGLALGIRLATSPATLSPAQLPLAPRGGSLAFAGSLPITISVLDPAHVLAFLERTGQRITTRLKPLLALATGDLIASSDTHTSLVRVGVSDAAAAARELSHVGAPLGHGFYTLTEGRDRITAGLASGQLVLGVVQGGGTTPNPATLTGFAAAPTTPAAGAQGTLAFRISLPALIGLAARGVSPSLLTGMLRSLGDVTGWAGDTTGGLTVRASLSVH